MSEVGLRVVTVTRFASLLRYLLLVACGALIVSCGSDPKSTSPAISQPAETETRDRSGGDDTRPLIVALGDSLTAGLGVDPMQTYPSKLQKKLDDSGYRYRVINAGVSGDTSAQGLNRLAIIRDQHPAVVIVALGANDGLRGIPVEVTRQNLETIIAELQLDGTKVVLAGMVIPPNYGSAYTLAFRELFPALAKKYRIPLVRFLLEGVAGKPDLNQADRIHPTAKGYDIVAENVWKVLRPLL